MTRIPSAVQGINKVLTTRAGWAPAKVQEIARGTFDDADWTRACEHGWSPEQFADAFASLAVPLMLDYFVHFAETPIDATPRCHSAESSAVKGAKDLTSGAQRCKSPS
jgi:hypothetical protein